jgi:hypothetical protein
MKGSHIFIANGDSCEACTALHGMFVPAGYKPHANCSCETVEPANGDTCTFDVTEEVAGWSGGKFMITLNIVVTCPDGTVHERSQTQMAFSTLFSSRGIDEIEVIAEGDCEDCEGNEFLCC